MKQKNKALRIIILIIFFPIAMPFLGLSYAFYGLSWLMGTVPASWFYLRAPGKGYFTKPLKQ